MRGCEGKHGPICIDGGTCHGPWAKSIKYGDQEWLVSPIASTVDGGKTLNLRWGSVSDAGPT